MSEYDEEEQNVLYFNDLFPFNIIHPNDLKTEKDNDDNDIDIIQSSEDMALPTCDQRHQYLRYEGLQYTDANIVDFDLRLTRIYRKEVHRVHVFNFGGLSDLMADGLSARMLMEHRHAQRVSLFGEAIVDLDMTGALQFQLGGARRRLSWRQFIIDLGLHMREKMESPSFARYWAESARQIPNKGDLRDYWIGITSARDFLGTAPSYTAIRDPILRLCHRLIACSIVGRSQAPEKVTVTDLFYLRGMGVGSVNVPYLLARYLRLFAAGRKSGAHISGQCPLLIGLTVIAPELLIIDMAELAARCCCWCPEAAKDAPAVDEGRLGRLEEEVQGLHRDVRSLRELMERSMTDHGRFSTWMISCMAQLIEASGLTYHEFDETFPGSSPAAFHIRTKQRTEEANTSTAQQDQQQPDP
ncbi:hypothetical protein Tco_0791199 [Tanacetum coccineum]